MNEQLLADYREVVEGVRVLISLYRLLLEEGAIDGEMYTRLAERARLEVLSQQALAD